MRKIVIAVLSLLVFEYNGTLIKAQESSGIYDTIHIIGKGNKPKYVITGAKIAKIKLSGYSPRLASKVISSLGRDIGRNALSLVTGLETGGTRDADLVINGLITTNDTSYNWRTDVYCKGRIEKETRRIKNEGGSYSTETSKQKYIYWSQGADGIILDSGDTLGRYKIIINPDQEPEPVKWITEVTKKEAEHGDTLFEPMWGYAICGELRGKESVILFNLALNKIYVFEGNDIAGYLLMGNYPKHLRRKDQVEYRLMIQEKLTTNERNDILRLAMFGLWMIIASR